MKKTIALVVFLCILIGSVNLLFAQSQESEPPDLYTNFGTGMSLPVPLSPSGPPLLEDTQSETIFKWTKVNGANSYVLWIQEKNGKIIHQYVKITPSDGDLKLECDEAICETPAISLNKQEGHWWVQALNVTEQKRSGWSRKAVFGTKEDKYARCVKPLGKEDEDDDVDRKANYEIEPGDLPWTRNDLSNLTRGEWTVGLAALAQAIKYDFAKKKAGFNNGLGAGVSFRFYRDVYVPGQAKKVPISRIRSDCRARTFQLRDETDIPDAAPVFSVTPTIFASQIVGEDNLKVEPAIMLGFFEDIINVGAGFNLSGKNGEVGDVFLLLSIGAGFNW
ncbi:hypothetical protein [Nitrospira sp. Ecomares 2.1]